MSRRARATALILLAFWPVALAQSWTDATRVRMIQDALKISPPALGDMLRRHEKDLVRGVLDPSRRESEEVHFQHADGRGLAGMGVERKMKEIRNLLERQASFSRVSYEMGVLAHLVADVEFPLNASDADPREPLYRDAYRLYIEKMLDRIPFVVDRDPPRSLARSDVRAFVMDIARRASRNYALIGPAYNDDGTPKSPAALDERSVPFGIASLSYSHAASDIAWVWRHLWESINGDMRGTPFLDAPPPEKARVPPRKPPRPAPPAARATPPAAPSPTPGTPPPAARPSPTPAAVNP